MSLIAFLFLILWLVSSNHYFKSETKGLQPTAADYLVAAVAGCGIAFAVMLLLGIFIGCLHLIFN